MTFVIRLLLGLSLCASGCSSPAGDDHSSPSETPDASLPAEEMDPDGEMDPEGDSEEGDRYQCPASPSAGASCDERASYLKCEDEVRRCVCRPEGSSQFWDCESL